MNFHVPVFTEKKRLVIREILRELSEDIGGRSMSRPHPHVVKNIAENQCEQLYEVSKWKE